MDTDIDLAFATLGENQQTFKYLQMLKPNLKIAFLHGNLKVPCTLDNLLTSDKWTYRLNRQVKNRLFIHEEFPLDFWTFEPPKYYNNIFSFLHLFHSPYRKDEYKHWVELQEYLKSKFIFKEYGHENRDGCPHSPYDVRDLMHKSTFIYHNKKWDAYGHVIHRAFAMGRPPIVGRGKDYYETKSAGDLMVDGETCIFIEDSLEDTIKKVQKYSHPEEVERMSVAANKKFNEVVDFEAEAGQVQL
jgi:hypothetical protein